ncbi:MAG TPA: nitroreductase/quinone reductase family protein [Solirubrobacterales bacterium]|nr:nitroreductase/quinone reductase family protein [Solirubrobacterales bacterium]
MTATGNLRRVDPLRPRSRLYRSWAWFTGSPLGLWLSRNVGWKIDPVLLRLTGGRFGTALVIPTALLETRGARSGRTRRNGVIYFHDRERVTIIASKAGAPEHPAWFHNIQAHPNDVRLNGRRFQAEILTDEAARARVWELADRVFPPFASYRESAACSGRDIPIVQLIPADHRG